MQTIKSFKLLIIALVVCNNLFSQTNVYKPFPQSSGTWSVSGQHYIGWPPTGSYLTYENYKTSGDTLIGAYTYVKVLYAHNISSGPFNFSPYAFKFAYRNDSINKKVYYLDVTNGINKDTLWYDFNLNIGDSLKETFAYTSIGYTMNNQRRIVSSIDSVLICGSYHKRFNFGCSVGGFETSLIEGAGFKDKFDVTGYLGYCPFEPSAVYSTGFSSCSVTSVQDYVKENQIKLFPSPANTELKINFSLQFTEYSILNSVGAVILKGNLSDLQSINISSLATGLYVIKIQDKSGNNYQSKFIKQ
jgi:hypothetical protein